MNYTQHDYKPSRSYPSAEFHDKAVIRSRFVYASVFTIAWVGAVWLPSVVGVLVAVVR